MREIKTYTNQIGITSQFRFCGNSFRIDTYRGCSFGCAYCFANNRNGKGFEGKNNFEVGDNKRLTSLFKKINDGKDYNDVTVELLRHRVPLHLGGMSDPLQRREVKYGCTKHLLELSKEYNYPLIISTKAAELPEGVLSFIDPAIHAFQISLVSMNLDLIRKLEKNTPSPEERVSFIKELDSKGFWTSVRIQPLLHIKDAMDVLHETHAHINYCTVEHLKIPKFNNDCWKTILPYLPVEYKQGFRPSQKKPEFELKKSIKLGNIKLLKQAFPNVRFGCGDNDLHEYSDSLNCCGVDTMPEAFSNWIKYNSMYIKMTGDLTQWVPEKPVHNCFNSTSKKKEYTYKDYVDKYFINIYGKPDGFFKH